MSSKKLYIGRIEVTFADGTTSDVRIYKSGRNIWINDDIVHPMNRNSFDGVIHEISVIRNKRIEKWDWVAFGPDYDKLQFRRYRTP
jgi:hypothetical protein